jgi:hypothetical protein
MEGDKQEKRRVYVALDWARDSDRRAELESWGPESDWEFVFCNATAGEVTAENVEAVKATALQTLKTCRYTLVLVGEGANQRDRSSRLLGFRNWMNWEVEESISNRNRICAVKLEWMNTSPDTLANTHATWAQRFEKEFVLRALRDA